MVDSPDQLWVRVNAQRIVQGLSFRGLAALLETSPSTITRWSRGRGISVPVLLRAQTWLTHEGAPVGYDVLGHEAMDRCSVVIDMLDGALATHAAVRARPEVAAKVAAAMDALHDAYQMLGAEVLR